MTTFAGSIFRFRYWLVKRSNRWLQPVIILVILLLSIALPVRGTLNHLVSILVMISAVFGMLVLLHWPVVGLIMIIIGSLFVPYSGPGGVNIALLGVIFLLGVSLLDMVVRKRKIQFVNSRAFLPVSFFLLVSVLALLNGQIGWHLFAQQAPLDAQLGGFAIYALSVGAFFLAGHRVENQDSLEWLVWLVLAEGVLVTSALFFQLRFVFRWIQLSALGSMFMNWFVALAFGQALINRRLRPILRLALIAAVLLTLYVAYVVLGNWKSGWVPPLVAIGVILFIKYPRRMIFFAPPAILLGWYLAGQVLAAEQYSWTTRLDAWTIVADIAKANPILGLGFGNYYWYVSLIPIRGFFVPFNSHNQYADLFAQMGLLGLVCFLWIFWELGRLGWRLRERVPEGFPRAYVYGVLGGLGGTLVAGALGDWVLPFVYNVGMKGFRASVVAWLFLGGLVALEQMYTRSVFEPKE